MLTTPPTHIFTLVSCKYDSHNHFISKFFPLSAEPDSSFDGDVCIEIDGVEASCVAVSGSNNASFSTTIGRDLFGAMDYFDLSLTSTGSTGGVFVYDLEIIPCKTFNT